MHHLCLVSRSDAAEHLAEHRRKGHLRKWCDGVDELLQRNIATLHHDVRKWADSVRFYQLHDILSANDRPQRLRLRFCLARPPVVHDIAIAEVAHLRRQRSGVGVPQGDGVDLPKAALPESVGEHIAFAEAREVLTPQGLRAQRFVGLALCVLDLAFEDIRAAGGCRGRDSFDGAASVAGGHPAAPRHGIARGEGGTRPSSGCRSGRGRLP
mmetsp:Transcript_74881/g.216478  ORF Transcript_74881/g.216478 Transcript_74881/m.216478 type:complete len:211 (+) Transcript_74881:561-1193(+)